MHAKTSWVAVAAGVFALAVPASASGATTVGQTFVPTANSSCLADPPPEWQVVQTARASGLSYAAPSDGVLTSWSFEAGTAQTTVLTLRVFRPTGTPHRYQVIADGSDELKTIPPSSGLNTFSTRISVQAGDLIGIRSTSGRCSSLTGNTGDTYDLRSGAGTPVGATADYSPLSGFIVDISAILEPDCDSDGFGDETQDPSVFGGDCPLRPRGVTLDANKNKVKKGKKVTLSGQVNEVVRLGECQATQTVELQRKKPSQSAFTTVELLQTDSAGSFSTEQKVKKTFVYQAQVPLTATCEGVLSDNTEKVKVKKKK